MAIVNLTPPYQQFSDNNGNPLSGGKIYTYIAGTLTPTATYTDQGGATPNANPVILDSAGRADIWLNTSVSYKFIVKTSADVTVRTVDNVTPFNTLSGLAVLGSIAANTIVGNNTGGSAPPTALTATQAQASMINNLPVVAVNTAADYVAFYDTSGATAGKALISSFVPASSTLGTPVATTSGTTNSLSGIPAGVNLIIVTLNGVSTNGTSRPQLQIGSGGALETSGYTAYGGYATAGSSSTSGFPISDSYAAADLLYGSFVLTRYSGNQWGCSWNVVLTSSNKYTMGGGIKTLSGAIDRVGLTTVSGADTFDAGAFNVVYL